MPFSLQDQVALARWERLYLDPDYDMALLRQSPGFCPYCGSIETRDNRCAWCHSEMEAP